MTKEKLRSLPENILDELTQITPRRKKLDAPYIFNIKTLAEKHPEYEKEILATALIRIETWINFAFLNMLSVLLTSYPAHTILILSTVFKRTSNLHIETEFLNLDILGKFTSSYPEYEDDILAAIANQLRSPETKIDPIDLNELMTAYPAYKLQFLEATISKHAIFVALYSDYSQLKIALDLYPTLLGPALTFILQHPKYINNTSPGLMTSSTSSVQYPIIALSVE